MGKKKQLFILGLLILICGSCLSVLKHNQDIAAQKAIEFAEAAFIERNYEKASRLLPVERQQPASVKQIEDLITKIHPASYPTKVDATEFEPIPGQKAIRIFLVGQNDQNEKFYYAILLTGTEGEGYNVIEVYRYPEPFPASQQRKQLPLKRSTANLLPVIRHIKIRACRNLSKMTFPVTS